MRPPAKRSPAGPMRRLATGMSPLPCATWMCPCTSGGSAGPASRHSSPKQQPGAPRAYSSGSWIGWCVGQRTSNACGRWRNAGAFIASVTEPVDSSSPIGLAMLRILVPLAGLESAITGIRVRASKRQAAEAGRPPPVKAYGLTLRLGASASSSARWPCSALSAVGRWPVYVCSWSRLTCGHWEFVAERSPLDGIATLGRLLRKPQAGRRPCLQGTGRRSGLLAGDPGSRDVRSLAADAQSPRPARSPDSDTTNGSLPGSLQCGLLWPEHGDDDT